MPQPIIQGYGTPQEIITQGFLSGFTPVAPKADIITCGWGASQIIVTQGFLLGFFLSAPYLVPPSSFPTMPEVLWTAATGGAAPYTYDVQRALSSDFTTGLVTLSAGQAGIGYADSGLTLGVTYYYRIIAHDMNAASVISLGTAYTPGAPTVSYNPAKFSAATDDAAFSGSTNDVTFGSAD